MLPIIFFIAKPPHGDYPVRRQNNILSVLKPAHYMKPVLRDLVNAFQTRMR